MRWNAHVHILDLCLYSHLKEFIANGVRSHVTPKGNVPSTGGLEEDQTRDIALRRTTSPPHYRLSYSGPQTWVRTPSPQEAFCRWRHTTDFTVVAALQCTWRDRVSAGTGWPRVSVVGLAGPVSVY